MPDEEAWIAWLSGRGAKSMSGDAETAVSALIDRFRRSCNRETLVDVITGQFFKTVGGKIVREHDVKSAVAEFHAQGYATRTEKVDDLGRGVSCIRVVALKRLPNIYDICHQRSVQRAYWLEDVCRFGGLVPGDPLRGLALGRSIFQPALMTGAAPPGPEKAHHDAAALDAPSADDLFADLAAEIQGSQTDLAPAVSHAPNAEAASEPPAEAAVAPAAPTEVIPARAPEAPLRHRVG
jgi:hypothetical protein